MSKRKNTIKNTYNVTNEIDYDKLAEAIVSALETQKQSQNQRSFTASMFSGICSIAFKIVSCCTAALTLGFIFLPFAKQLGIYNQEFIVSFPNVISLIICISLFGTFSFLFWKASDEIENEKDKNYIIALFSSLVSVAALIVASLSLYYSNR